MGRGGGGNFNNNFNNAAGGAGAAGGQGNAPFDPQALANLYTRMFQMASGGMNPMGMEGAIVDRVVVLAPRRRGTVAHA